MTQIKQLFFKQTEEFEYEFFEDEKHTKPFDFQNADKVYIHLKEGSITPLLSFILQTKYTSKFKIYIASCSETANIMLPFITNFAEYVKLEIEYYFINANIEAEPKYCYKITPNYSKYIPEDCGVVFLDEESRNKYSRYFDIPSTSINKIETSGMMERNVWTGCNCCNPTDCLENYKELILFIPKIISANIQEINNTAKELKEKYGVEWAGISTPECYLDYVALHYKCMRGLTVITTDATGVLEPQESEHLKVISCKEIFENYLATQK